MSKSLDEIWKQMEIERQMKFHQEQIAEQKKIELSELAKQEYLELIKEDKISTSTSVSSSSAAGSRLRTPISSIVGESVFFVLQDDNIWKYIIYNYITDTLTSVISFELNTSDWFIIRHISVTDKGFILIFNDDNGTNKVFILGLEGNKIYQSTIGDFTSNNFSTLSYILYNDVNENTTLVLYDGTVRQISLGTNAIIEFNGILDDLSNNGLVFKQRFNYPDSLPEDNLYYYKYYFIKNGSTTTKLLFEETPDTIKARYYLRQQSGLFFIIASNWNEVLLENIYVYGIDGLLVLSYNLSDISTFLQLNNADYIGYNGSFAISCSDSENNVRYFFYYNYLSNTITYKFVDASVYTNVYSYLGLNSYQDYDNYLASSAVFILFSGYDNVYSNIYADDSLILPIFDTCLSIPDFITFSTISDGRTLGFNSDLRRDDSSITIVCDLDTDSKVLSIRNDNTFTYVDTDITSPIDVIINLKDRMFMSESDLINTSHFYNIETLSYTMCFATYSNNSNIYYRRNTLLITESDNNQILYSNSSTGDTLLSYDFRPDNIDITNSRIYDDNLSIGGFILNDSDTKTALILSDHLISGSFSYSYATSSISKITLSLTKDYLSVTEFITFGGDYIPYTHTQLSENGPTEAYIMDVNQIGIILPGDGYFSPIGLSPSSEYFTNLYPGIFVLSVAGMYLSEFRVYGGLGADGSGTATKSQYSTTYNGHDYTIYTKTVGGTSDPSVNHIMIINNNGVGITHSISLNTDNDDDALIGLNNTDKLTYLVVSQANGVVLTTEQIENIVNQCLPILDGNDLDGIRTTFLSNYSFITSQFDPYYFSDQGSSGRIDDGGNDMYDGGNIMIGFYGQNAIDYLSSVSIFDLTGTLVSRSRTSSYDTLVDNWYGSILTGESAGIKSIVRSTGEFYQLIDIQNMNIDRILYNDYIWWND